MTQENTPPDALPPSGHANATPEAPYDIVDPVTGEVAATHGSQTGTVFAAERPAVENIIDQYIADPRALAEVLTNTSRGAKTPEQMDQLKAIQTELKTYPWQEKRAACGFAGDDLQKQDYARGLLGVLDTELPKDQAKEERAIRVEFLRGALNTMYAPLEKDESGNKTELVAADIDSEVDLQHELIARALEKNSIQITDAKGTPIKGTVGRLMQLFNGESPGIIKTGDFFHWSGYFGLVMPQRDQRGRYVNDQKRSGQARQNLNAINDLSIREKIPARYKEYMNEYRFICRAGDVYARRVDKIASRLPTYIELNKAVKVEAENTKGEFYDLGRKFRRDVPLMFYKHILDAVGDEEYDFCTLFLDVTQNASPQDWKKRLQLVNPQMLKLVIESTGINEDGLARIIDKNSENSDLFSRSVYWYCGLDPSKVLGMLMTPMIEKQTKGQSKESFQAVQIHKAGEKSSRTVWIPNDQRQANVYAQALAISKSNPDLKPDLHAITYGGGNYLMAQPYSDGSFMIRVIVPTLPTGENALAFYTDVNIDSYALPDGVKKGPEGQEKYDPGADLRHIMVRLNRPIHDRPDVYELSNHPTLGKFAERAAVKPSADGYEVIFALAGNPSIYPKSDEPRITCHIRLTDKQRIVELDAESTKALRPEQKDYLTWLGLRFFESSSIVSSFQHEEEVAMIRRIKYPKGQVSKPHYMDGESASRLVFIGNHYHDGSAGVPSEAKKREFGDHHLGKFMSLDELNANIHLAGEHRNRTLRRVTAGNGNTDAQLVARKRQALIESGMIKVMAGKYNPHLRRELPAGFPHGHQVIEE